jgi:hypothetical protein
MKTNVLYKAFLSKIQLKEYLIELTRLGKISHNPDTNKYYIRASQQYDINTISKSIINHGYYLISEYPI